MTNHTETSVHRVPYYRQINYCKFVQQYITLLRAMIARRLEAWVGRCLIFHDEDFHNLFSPQKSLN
jgi:hypothetical protein